MARVALYTLGCKVNQYETQKIADDFRGRGFDVVGFADQADVYIINSCTVTHTADSKSRQAARAAMHRNPSAMVVLTGCYAETSSEQVSGIDGISMVIGNSEKSRIVERVMDRLPKSLLPAATPEILDLKSEIPNRTRALLKIQDGCDQFCAYCAVPLARSVMSSKSVPEVLAEARELAEQGFKEIVLTGIRLGRYEGGGADLTSLLNDLVEIRGIERIRLSSIEITDVTPGLLELMAENPKVCRHLHLPLQSGDDAVLHRMNRPYDTTAYADFTERARPLIPGVAITTDIMVGFVGETPLEFENTFTFAQRMEFARAHVFRYSPRKDTAAAGLRDDVPMTEKERRSACLMELAASCSQRFAEAFAGKTVSVLVESKQVGSKMRSGLTDNYQRVVFEAGSHLVGEIMEVRVESALRGTAYGSIADG